MKRIIPSLILLVAFFCGFYVNGLRWQTKLDDYKLQAAEEYSIALEKEVAKKDATINLLLSQGQQLKASSSDLALTVGRLQQSIKVSNSQLGQNLDSNRKLVECQNLLSESTQLLREGVDLSTSLVIKIK